MADGERAIQLIRDRFPDAIVDCGSFRDQHWAVLKADRLVEICRWLHDDPEMSYDFLVDVTGAHWPDEPQPVELIYHLYSFTFFPSMGSVNMTFPYSAPHESSVRRSLAT